MTESESLPKLVSIDELADHLGTSSRHIRRLIAERRVPYLKVGGRSDSTCPRSRAGSNEAVLPPLQGLPAAGALP